MRGGGSQMCEESGNLKLKSEAVSCVLEIESFQICNLLMGAGFWTRPLLLG